MHEAIVTHLYAMDEVQYVPSCWPCIVAMGSCLLFWTGVGALVWWAL